MKLVVKTKANDGADVSIILEGVTHVEEECGSIVATAGNGARLVTDGAVELTPEGKDYCEIGGDCGGSND